MENEDTKCSSVFFSLDQNLKILYNCILFLKAFIQYLPGTILSILHILPYLIFILTLWKKKQTQRH